jgi:hypothetical protein
MHKRGKEESCQGYQVQHNYNHFAQRMTKFRETFVTHAKKFVS